MKNEAEERYPGMMAAIEELMAESPRLSIGELRHYGAVFFKHFTNYGKKD